MKLTRIHFQLLMTLIVVYPFIFLIYALYPVEIFGTNAYVMICALLVYYLFFYSMLIEPNKRFLLSNVVVVLLFIIVLSANFIVQGVDQFEYIVDYRIGLSLVVAITISQMVGNIKYYDLIFKIILVSAIVQGYFGIAHHYFIPEYVLNTSSLAPGGLDTVFVYLSKGIRESGTLQQPSLYAGIVLLGQFLFVTYCKDNNKLGLFWLFISLSLFYAIHLSGSRLPFVFSTILTVLHAFRVFQVSNFVKKLFVCLIVGFFVYLNIDMISPLFEKLFMRGFDDLRIIKYGLGLDVVFDKWSNMFFGTRRWLMSPIRADGIRFTDNSFIMLLLHFGLIYTALLVIYVASSLWVRMRKVFNFELFLFTTYFFLTLFFTSAIGWDIFILYSFLVMQLISLSSKYSFDKYQRKINDI